MTRAKLTSEYRRFPSHWEIASFEEIIKDKTGGNPKIKKGDYAAEGRFPVVDQGQDFIGGYTDDIDNVAQVSPPCIIFGDHTRIFKYIDFSFALGADGVKLLKPDKQLLPKFAYYYLRQFKLPENAGYSRHFKFLKQAYIPIPPPLRTTPHRRHSRQGGRGAPQTPGSHPPDRGTPPFSLSGYVRRPSNEPEGVATEKNWQFTTKTHKTMLKNQSVFSYPWVARMFWIRPCRFS